MKRTKWILALVSLLLPLALSGCWNYYSGGVWHTEEYEDEDAEEDAASDESDPTESGGTTTAGTGGSGTSSIVKEMTWQEAVAYIPTMTESMTLRITNANLGAGWEDYLVMAFADSSLPSSIKVTLDLSPSTELAGINGYTFEGFTYLVGLILPFGADQIGEKAFKDCTSLESVTIPSSVTVIGSYAFAGCTSLKSVTIPILSSNAFLASTFADCTSLETINFFGTKEEWNQIHIRDKNWNKNCPATVVHCLADGEDVVLARDWS